MRPAEPWMFRDIERLCKDLDDVETYLKREDSNGQRVDNKGSSTRDREV